MQSLELHAAPGALCNPRTEPQVVPHPHASHVQDGAGGTLQGDASHVHPSEHFHGAQHLPAVWSRGTPPGTPKTWHRETGTGLQPQFRAPPRQCCSPLLGAESPPHKSPRASAPWGLPKSLARPRSTTAAKQQPRGKPPPRGELRAVSCCCCCCMTQCRRRARCQVLTPDCSRAVGMGLGAGTPVFSCCHQCDPQ